MKKKSFLVLTSGKFLEALGSGIGTCLVFCLSFLFSNIVMYVQEILGLKSKLFRKWPLIQNGPPITLLRVCGLSFVLKLAAMYFCEPEYDMTYLYVYTVTKNTCQTVTVRFFE